VNPSGFISPRLRVLWFGVVLMSVATALRADPADDRMANLQEKIATMEGVVSNAKNAAEKSRLDENLQRLRRELEILENRKAIDQREQQFRATRPRDTFEILREKLRNIVLVSADVETHIQQIVVRLRQVAAERDALVAQVSAASADSPVRVQLQERLETKRAELDALVLEREAAEAELELAHDADQLRKKLREIDTANVQPSLRALFETYTLLSEERKTGNKLAADIAMLERKRKSDEEILDINQQKLANAAGDAAQLEKQMSFFNRDPKKEALLVEARGKKDVLGERLPFLTRQVEADKHSESVFGARQELASLQTTFQQEQYDTLKAAYLHRLRWPAVALTAMILVQVLAGYLLLPIFYKNESLVLARRLVRYILVVAATVVVAGFLFEDIKVVAAAGGLVSAALVISLQDVCASMFAWFVIMLGGKFGIGDRLEVDGTRGDVIDIDLLRTTLLEVNGWLGTDSPTGRVITLPNNFIFKTKVFNFTHGHPYIWGKIDLTVNAATPIAAALALFERVLEEEAGDQFAAAQAASAAMRRRYGVEDAVYKPKINFVIVETGVLMNLFYVAHYRQNSTVRNKIGRRLIAELEKHPHIQLSCPTLQILHDNLVPGAPSAVYGSASGPVPSRVVPQTVIQPSVVPLRN
jgi:small-conductance mechanosensitive channel